jgi:hypothetical protein
MVGGVEMVCQGCGASFTEEVRFCPKCGAQIVAAQHAYTPTSLSFSPPTLSVSSKLDYPTAVVVTDFEMPFTSMCLSIIKWALASIPALLILTIIFTIIFSIFTALILHR